MFNILSFITKNMFFQIFLTYYASHFIIVLLNFLLGGLFTMAFCEFCGTQLSDDAVFCPNCGNQKGEQIAPAPAPTAAQAPVQNVPPQPDNQNIYQSQQYVSNMPYQAAPAPKKKSKLPFIAVALIAVVALFFIFKNGVFGGGNYETPIKYFCEAMSEASLSKLYKALPPTFEKYVSSALGLMGMNEEDLLDELGIFSEAGVSVKYEIISKEPLTKDELEDYSDDLSSFYMKTMDVKTGYMLHIRFEMDGDVDYEDIAVGKVEGRWCIIEDFY